MPWRKGSPLNIPSSWDRLRSSPLSTYYCPQPLSAIIVHLSPPYIVAVSPFHLHISLYVCRSFSPASEIISHSNLGLFLVMSWINRICPHGYLLCLWLASTLASLSWVLFNHWYTSTSCNKIKISIFVVFFFLIYLNWCIYLLFLSWASFVVFFFVM